jgi:hypothetical protein
MKILLVHNFYGSGVPSGENQVFEIEKNLLQARGHEVETFIRQSDEIRNKGFLGMVQGALATPWNPWMYKAIKVASAQFQPDVVHVHNTFPLISPAIFRAIGRNSARVLTLHIIGCFARQLFLYEMVKCVQRVLIINLPAFHCLHCCYRGSRIASIPLELLCWTTPFYMVHGKITWILLSLLPIFRQSLWQSQACLPQRWK